MERSHYFESKHFDIHTLANGVFAAIATDGGLAIGNAGLIDLGGQIIVFDTFITPAAAGDLRRFSIEHLGGPPDIVINSHYHNDHIWGNQVFADEAVIMSSSRTRELIVTAGQEEYAWYSANSAQRLKSLQDQFEHVGEAERKDLSLWISYFQGLVEELPHTRVHLPQITVKVQFEFHGTNLSAELFSFADGHTGSDTVLFLPESGILFMSDLLFIDCHPYLADGNPEKLLTTLKSLSQLDAAHLVPGHGPVGTKADLDIMIEYVESCLETAQALVDTGDVDEARIKDTTPTGKFGGWQFPRFYQANIQFLCAKLTNQ